MISSLEKTTLKVLIENYILPIGWYVVVKADHFGYRLEILPCY